MKVKELASTLKRMKFNVAAMHSDLEQSQREEVMKEFKNGRIDILVATDVVSRGIDINDIKLVINFDIPPTGRLRAPHRPYRPRNKRRRAGHHFHFNRRTIPIQTHRRIPG